MRNRVSIKHVVSAVVLYLSIQDIWRWRVGIHPQIIVISDFLGSNSNQELQQSILSHKSKFCIVAVCRRLERAVHLPCSLCDQSLNRLVN